MIDVFGARGCTGCDATMAMLRRHGLRARLRRPETMSERCRQQIPPGYSRTPLCFDNGHFVPDLARHLGLAAEAAVPPGDYVVYGRDSCGYTQAALELLETAGITPTYHNDSGRRSMPPDHAAQTAHYRTVPMLFRNGAFIGGYTDLTNA